MIDDAELLRRFDEQRSEPDFTEFVGRHFNVVYHAALRRTRGRADLAQDAAQEVFTAAASRASVLKQHHALAGWLHLTTRHAVNNLLRAERRRMIREEVARLMNEPSASDGVHWDRVRQELDHLLDDISTREREAILLRYFHGRTFGQIGALFGLNEEAARKRVERALDRLREKLARRGFTSTSAALGAVLAGEAALAAPVGCAAAAAETALLHAASGTASGMALLPLMSLKTTLAFAVAGVVAFMMLGVAVVATRGAHGADAELARAQRDFDGRVAVLGKLRADGATQRRPVEARPTPPVSPLSTVSAPDASTAADQRGDRRANAKKFLDSVPQASALARTSIDAWLRNYCPQFYRTAHLTAAQIEEFENMATAGRLESIEIWPEGPGYRWTLESNIPVDLVRQKFGDEVARQFEENRRMYGGNFVASAVASYAARAGVPLSDAQTDQIAQAVAENNSTYRAGKLIGSSSLVSPAQDWDSTMAAARRILSPAQWAASEYEFTYYRFRQGAQAGRRRNVQGDTEIVRPDPA